jgi:predicted RNase H-like HicB family nuclease
MNAIRSMIAALLIASLASASLAQDDAPKLKRYKTEEGNFSVMLPGEPKAQRVPIKDPADKDAKQVQYVFGTDDGAYLVSYQDNPKLVEADEASAEEALKSAQEGLDKAFGELLSEKAIKLADRYPGRELEFEVKGEKGGLYRARLYLVDGRLYQVVVVGTKEFATSKTAAAMLDSFALLRP